MKLKDKLKLKFNKNKCLLVYYYTADKKMVETVVKPKDGKFIIEGEGYIVNSDNIYMKGSIPFSVYYQGTAEPIDIIKDGKSSELSSKDFYNAIEANVVKEIIRSSESDDKHILYYALAGGIISVLAVGIGVYMIMGEIGGLMETIEEMQESIKTLQDINNR